MKKAEMEAHSAAYRNTLQRAKNLEEQGMYRLAMKEALSAWDHVDGMMQHAQKYEEQEAPDVEAIELVLKYAPLLLDTKSLAQLGALIAEVRRIARKASLDIPAALAHARRQIDDNHQLWLQIEQQPDISQNELITRMRGTKRYWEKVLESWEKMGLITRQPAGPVIKISLATRMGELVQGKCNLCGNTSRAPKAMLLSAVKCPNCRRLANFVIIATPAPRIVSFK